jgi:hypothetical protein
MINMIPGLILIAINIEIPRNNVNEPNRANITIALSGPYFIIKYYIFNIKFIDFQYLIA